MLLRRAGVPGTLRPAPYASRHRLVPRPVVAEATSAGDDPTTSGRRDESLPPIVIRSLGPPRTPGAPPRPPPVEHSTAYLLRNRGGADGSDEASLAALTAPRRPPPAVDPAAPFTGSAVEWALRRVDGALDAAEADPPPGAKVVLDAARSPAGAAAAGAAAAAARGAVALGGTALKAAIPVGKWALGATAKAAVGLVVGNQRKKDEKK